jgi:hypothetical protein
MAADSGSSPSTRIQIRRPTSYCGTQLSLIPSSDTSSARQGLKGRCHRAPDRPERPIASDCLGDPTTLGACPSFSASCRLAERLDARSKRSRCRSHGRANRAVHLRFSPPLSKLFLVLHHMCERGAPEEHQFRSRSRLHLDAASSWRGPLKLHDPGSVIIPLLGKTFRFDHWPCPSHRNRRAQRVPSSRDAKISWVNIGIPPARAARSTTGRRQVETPISAAGYQAAFHPLRSRRASGDCLKADTQLWAFPRQDLLFSRRPDAVNHLSIRECSFEALGPGFQHPAAIGRFR